MITTQTLAGRQIATAECALVAQASFRASPEEIPALRKVPDPSGGLPVHPSLLRHADEQTVVGLAAVFRAARESGLGLDEFEEWAVLVAPRYLGRAAFERAFPTFRAEGAWGVSPHLIPAHSLHSPSGTISQALKAQGPNLGVGGTPAGERQALLFASTLLLAGSCPGVWVVLTGRESERNGAGVAGDYEALALALAPSTPGVEGPRLRVSPGEFLALGTSESSSRAIGRWLALGALRGDGSQRHGAVPPPHIRPNRPNRAPGSGDAR